MEKCTKKRDARANFLFCLIDHYAKNLLKSGKPKVRQDMRLTAVAGQEKPHRPEATQ